MNKYKMISICSLTIACLLVLSILLPVKTVANEKESIELSMHYENAEVTANIVVNSDVYTSIVCKYLVTDDVLTSEDILAQTRDTGATINLDKSEDDKYTATVKDVNKRYVVFYISIGNCSLCDYIDCEPGKDSNESKNEEQPDSSDEGHDMSVTGVGENGQEVEATTDNKPEEKPAEEPKQEEQPVEEPKQEQPVEEPKQEQPVEQPTENKPAQQEEQPAENNDEKIVVDNNDEQQQNDFQSIEEIPSTNNGNNEVQNNNQNQPVTNKEDVKVASNNNTKPTVSNGDKDSVDTSDFEEIEKVVSTSTADDNMPQTGEDDFAKILGIVVFSCISVVSFYKYKTTK